MFKFLNIYTYQEWQEIELSSKRIIEEILNLSLTER